MIVYIGIFVDEYIYFFLMMYMYILVLKNNSKFWLVIIKCFFLIM